MDSILTSVKKLLGIAESYTAFDPDIIMYINAVFLGLCQLGVGPAKAFSISDSGAVWNDFLPGDERARTIASYMAAKVRMAFDPPQSSTAMDALKSTIAEMEFRLSVEFDTHGVERSTHKQLDYNDLANLPSLNGVTLRGSVKMDIVSTADVEGLIGGVADEKF